MVGMAVRNEHSVQIGDRNARFDEALAARLARIDQHQRIPTAQQTG